MLPSGLTAGPGNSLTTKQNNTVVPLKEQSLESHTKIPKFASVRASGPRATENFENFQAKRS